MAALGVEYRAWTSLPPRRRPGTAALLPFLREAHQAICLVVIYLAAIERCCPQTPHPCSSSCCVPRWRLSGPEHPPVLQHQPTLFLCNIDELQVWWRRRKSAYEPDAWLAEQGGQGYNSGANGGLPALQEAPLGDCLRWKHHGREWVALVPAGINVLKQLWIFLNQPRNTVITS